MLPPTAFLLIFVANKSTLADQNISERFDKDGAGRQQKTPKTLAGRKNTNTSGSSPYLRLHMCSTSPSNDDVSGPLPKDYRIGNISNSELKVHKTCHYLGRNDIEQEAAVLGEVPEIRLISGDELVDVVEVVLGLRVLVELLLHLRVASPVDGRVVDRELETDFELKIDNKRRWTSN